MKLITFFIAAAAMIIISGCATPVYRQVINEKASFNQKDYAVSQDILYQAVVRAMLGRSFIIENEQPAKGFILSKRTFQEGRKTTALLLQAKIVSDVPNNSRLYLSAVETTERSYVTDRTRFFLFIIPLPGGGGKEATQIKEGEKVVQDKVFYRKFFNYINDHVQELVRTCKPAQQEITAVTAPVPAQPASAQTAPAVPAVVPAPSVPPALPVTAPPDEQAAAQPAPASEAAPVPAETAPAPAAPVQEKTL